MKKTFFLLIALLAAGVVVGCGQSGDDKALETAAPPPSAGAVPEAPKTDKNRPGAAGMAGGGAGAPSNGMASATAKPAGQ